MGRVTQVKRKIAFQGEAHKRRAVAKAVREKARQSGRIPRIAKLVALASRMQSMIESGQVDSYQQLAELGRISQPRMTRIISLLLLAPDIQEELLYLPEVIQGKAFIHERLLRPLTREIDWRVQRRMWGRIKADPRRILFLLQPLNIFSADLSPGCRQLNSCLNLFTRPSSAD